MIPSFPSSEALRPLPIRNNLYTNVMFQQNRYRLRTKQYLSSKTSIQLWQVFWSVAFFPVLALIGSQYLNSNLIYKLNQYSIFFTMTLIGSSLLMLYSLRNRNNIGQMLIYSLCALTLYMAAGLITTLVSQNKLIFSTIFYISAQVIGSMVLLENRSQVLGKVIILLQILLIVMKLDHVLDEQWQTLLFGFILSFFICLAFILSVGLFLTVNICWLRQPLSSLKHVGIIYILIMVSLFFMASTVVLCGNFLAYNKLIPSVIMLAFVLFLNYYSHFFKNQVALFLCKSEKVKSNNEIISLSQMPQQSFKEQVFLKKSDLWYQKITKKQLVSKERQKQGDSVNIGEDKCLVCLFQEPNVVWMPCGHLCVCMECAEKILQNKNSSCILCKNTPQNIYLVSETAQLNVQNYEQKLSGLKIHNQEIIIEQELVQNGPQNLKTQKLAEVMYPLKAYSVNIC